MSFLISGYLAPDMVSKGAFKTNNKLYTIVKVTTPNEVSNKVVKIEWGKGNMLQDMQWEDEYKKPADGSGLPNSIKAVGYNYEASGVGVFGFKVLESKIASEMTRKRGIELVMPGITTPAQYDQELNVEFNITRLK